MYDAYIVFSNSTKAPERYYRCTVRLSGEVAFAATSASQRPNSNAQDTLSGVLIE